MKKKAHHKQKLTTFVFVLNLVNTVHLIIFSVLKLQTCMKADINLPH